MDFFDEICSIGPELSRLESSLRLNEFEQEILEKYDAYKWDEWAQNALIIECYRRKYAGKR